MVSWLNAALADDTDLVPEKRGGGVVQQLHLHAAHHHHHAHANPEQ